MAAVLPYVAFEEAATVAPAIPAAARAGMSVAARAWGYAKAALPHVASAAGIYLATASGNKSAESVVKSTSTVAQQAVVKALLDAGMSVADFVRESQLTAAEARQYAQLIAAYQVKQATNVDNKQADRATTGSDYLDRVSVNMEIKDICTVLGVSSDFYARLISGINTHTTKDIEMFQLDRRVRGEKSL